MGFLRLKKVKNHEYVYWSKRVRTSKKQVGKGTVRSIDLLLGGSSTSGRYLPYYLYTGEIELKVYAEVVINKLWSQAWTELLFQLYEGYITAPVPMLEEGGISHSIDWKRKKFQLKSHMPLLDCRWEFIRYTKQPVQEALDQIILASDYLQNRVDRAAWILAFHHWLRKSAERLREIASEARKESLLLRNSFDEEPQRQWAEGFDIKADDLAAELSDNADEQWEIYQQKVKGIVTYAPKQKHQDFKRSVLAATEKLSQNKRWIDKFEAKHQIDTISAQEYAFKLTTRACG